MKTTSHVVPAGDGWQIGTPVIGENGDYKSVSWSPIVAWAVNVDDPNDECAQMIACAPVTPDGANSFWASHIIKSPGGSISIPDDCTYADELDLLVALNGRREC